MSDLQYRLVKHFTKPEQGEYVPIGFIEMTTETVAWSPKMNHRHIGALMLALPEDASRVVLEGIKRQQWEFSNYTGRGGE